MRVAVAAVLALLSAGPAAAQGMKKDWTPDVEAMGRLQTSLGAADVDAVAALLDGGLGVGGAAAGPALVAATGGLASACAAEPVREEAIGQSLALLVRHGFAPATADELDNTLLLSIAQFCPAAVASRWLQLGAPPDPVNRQDFTPLKMALVGGKWDMATVLVEAGARLSPAAAKEIFMEPPAKREQKALLERAAR